MRLIIRARRRFQNCVTIMSKSSEKSLCTSEDEDAQERSSETRTNEKGEAQKDERRNLLCYLTKKMYPSDFRNWPILSLLKPEFIMQIRMVMVYGYCGNRALIVTQEKDVYTLDYDYFKTGDTHIGLYPKKVEKLCGKNIKTLACNSYLILALTEEGKRNIKKDTTALFLKKVYSWGFNKKRKSDDGSHTPVFSATPTRVAGLSDKRIVDIACGSGHSLALTSHGKVYAWGENNYGQVGNENTNIVYVPWQVKHELEGKKIVHIACGSIFNMVVTDKGKLYGWGDNKIGQISIDHTTLIRYIPDIISQCGFRTSLNVQQREANSQKHYLYLREITAVLDKVIVKVACGSWHTLALTDEGKIYAWGKNDKGQVGVNNNWEISAPVMINVPELVSDIAAYDNLSVAVDTYKTIFI
ncbi:rcc1 and btb domain-containing protein 1, partial [Lasius niger]